MADEEAEKDRGPEDDVNVVLTGLTQRLQELQETTAKESQDSPVQSSFNFCQDFCRALLESVGLWRIEDEPVPVVRVYMVALWSFAETSAYLSLECDSVPLVVERLALSFVELLLSQKELPENVWNDFKSCVQFSHRKLQENGIPQLSMLWTLGQQRGVWANPVLQSILSGEELQTQQIEEFLVQEGRSLLELRVKQLIKDQQLEKAARLARTCSESALCEGKANFKQMYLVCLCTTMQQDQLMEELSNVDCRDALEMICNLESDGDEKGAFTLCSAFLSRQLLQADAYCAWELTLFWSKLLKRLEPSEKAFLDKCCQMSLLSKTVYHILFLIKVIQSEINEAGLSACIEMCIKALRMQSEDGNTKTTVCKTIACLLPNDLEVKRACQLTQFLLEPTVDSYYAVETLYNEPDQKLDEEKMAVPTSLRCELLLVFKTQWPFDPEFWDWKTLKRRCLALMGEEASIVSSIDSLNDTDEEEDMYVDDGFLESADRKVSGTYELTDKMDKKQKNREMKKLREKGFISARFRNWQVYMQYCVLCDKEFLGHRIIRHAQIHYDRGVYSCPICTQSFNSKDTLIPHVTSHVKQSSKDRLTAMKASRKLSNSKTSAPMMASLICKTENQVSESGGLMGQNSGCIQNIQSRLSEEPSAEVVCPVGTCKKTFKFYRNLIAHVKAHRDNEEAKSYLDLHSNKVVCQYCRRHFVNVNHLNDHLQVHCGTKPYICIQLNCKASFLSNTELIVHRKTHSHFKARCMFPNCGKVFHEAFRLYDHEAKHYKTFTCKFVDCGKVFHTQQQLDLHHKDHTIKKEKDITPPNEQTPSSSSLNQTQTIPDEYTLNETENLPEKCRAETVSVGKPETLENLLKASQTPIRTIDRYEIKTEVQDEVLISESCHSVNTQTDLSPAELHCKKETPPSHTHDHLSPCPVYQKQHISPFEATINKMLREKTVLQSELQFFSSSFNKGLIQYSGQPVSNTTRQTPPQTQPISVAATQSIPMAAATQSISMAATTQHTPMATTSQHTPMVATNHTIPMVATKPHAPMAATTQHAPMAATTQHIPMAATTKSSPMAPTTQHNPMTVTTQHIPMAAATKHFPIVATTQSIAMTEITPHTLLAKTTQHTPMAGKNRSIPVAATPQHIPVATAQHISVATAQHIPVATTQHIPVATTKHIPVATTQHIPVATTQHIPAATTQHIPAATTQHIPAATTQHIPAATTQHIPVATTQHIPVATTQHIPVATTQHIPVATTQHIPVPTTQHIPVATTQHFPVATTQHFPVATTQPIPVAATQLLPTAEKLQAVAPAEATSSAGQKEEITQPKTETFLRERYHCPFDMCTRNYSCYKSVAKHIKTSHPDMYAIRRIPRCEIKVTYVEATLPVPKPLGSIQKAKPHQQQTPQPNQHQTTQVILPLPHTSVVTHSNAVKLHPPVNPTGPQLMENVLNPIVVAQLKTTTNPQSSLHTLNQPVFSMATQQNKVHKCGTGVAQVCGTSVALPMATQQKKVHKCGTAMSHLPRPTESIPSSIVPKSLTESNPVVTGTNSIQVSSIQNGFQPPNRPTSTSGALRTPNSQAIWSVPHQNQQVLSSATCQLHSTRLAPSATLPLSSDHQPSISIDPNVVLANSLTKAHKDRQSSVLYKQSTNIVPPPKTQIKTEEENLPLWSPASEINNVQLCTPPQTLPKRAPGAASVPLPFKDNPRGSLLGTDINQTSVICSSTSNTRCSPLPRYTPPQASPPLIKKTHLHKTKHSKMLPIAINNTNVPIPAKGPPPISVETNDNKATSMQICCKPPLPTNIKTENCHATLSTPQSDSTELKNTNIVQNPQCQPLQNQTTAEENPENCKALKKRNKVRWPAIVKDGKVFCPRCYRSFSSTKSLGGHLSKRLRCNPYEEMELNADLPASFLDLLNSDQAVSSSEKNQSINPLETYHNKPHTSVEQTSYTSQTCQDQLDGETSDTLKQIMKAANLADLCLPPQSSGFQKPCVSTGKSIQTSGVLQSVEGGVQDVCSSNLPHYPQPRPPGKRYPTPLLSQALKETSASVKATSKCQSEIPSKDQVKVSNTVTSIANPKSPPTNKAKHPEQSTVEQNIKKKLREQILAGDFQRRNNLSHSANACHNFETQSPLSCSSDSNSKNEDSQMNWDAKSNWPKGETSAIIPGTAAEIEELLKTQSFTILRQNSASRQDLQSLTSMSLSDDMDTEPQQLSLSQQQCFSELLSAFESLNLIRESPEPVSDLVHEPIGTDTVLSSSSKLVSSDDSPTPTLAAPKIFTCVSENCSYITLSSAAFWRHLNKIHEFGFEQINAVKQKYGHYATFQCQKCPRTFTRNPNLKSHYISVHQLSTEEIEELDLKRKKERAAMTRLITVQSVAKQELQLQKPSDSGGTSVIQSLPSANMQSVPLKQTGHGRMCTAGHCTTGHQRSKSSKPFPNGCQLPIAHLPQTEVSPHAAKRPLTAGKQPNRPGAAKISNDLLKKTDKKPTLNDALSQYKPYRCVHKDCEAAFTIQHNLILHYRAVHQSALSALEVNKEQDQNEADEAVEQEEEEEELHISEFRCQVKDCSRVFQEVLHLMQHYLRLHEFTIDKVGDLLSVIRLGRFTCGHEGCTVSFTAFWKYVAHIKELHKDIKLSKPEYNMYKCEIEGCDRAYATKSNMLRHLMKKHNDYYLQRQPKAEDGVKQNSKPQYQLNKTSDGKENIESNKTSPQKDNDSKRTRKINNYWTKYEKPVLKSNVEASAMCTKSYPLQYPCMIKGCESVMNSEKSILKHYTVHGLSEKFLEQHRSHYIFCKKFPRQKNGSVRSDDSKSDQSSDSELELTGHNGTEETQLEGSRPFLRKRTSPIIPAALLDSLSNDDSSDGSLVIKRKRGRPKRITEKIVKRKKVSHPPKEDESRDDGSNSSIALLEESSEQPASLAAFKPMGFEMSFLKFLEQSNKTQPSLPCEIPLIGPWVRLSQLNTKETCVKFNNRQNLKSLDKVRIVVDKTFAGVTELMLKQLQDMQPMVLLEKK